MPRVPRCIVKRCLSMRWPKRADRRTLVCDECQRDAADGIRRKRDACLLTPAEMASGQDVWAQLPDPFPEWAVESVEDDVEADDVDDARAASHSHRA